MLRGRCPGLPGTPRRASAHSTGVETEADSFGMELQVALLAAAGSRARREPPRSGALARGSADRGPAVLPKRLGGGERRPLVARGVPCPGVPSPLRGLTAATGAGRFALPPVTALPGD